MPHSGKLVVCDGKEIMRKFFFGSTSSDWKTEKLQWQFHTNNTFHKPEAINNRILHRRHHKTPFHMKSKGIKLFQDKTVVVFVHSNKILSSSLSTFSPHHLCQLHHIITLQVLKHLSVTMIEYVYVYLCSSGNQQHCNGYDMQTSMQSFPETRNINSKRNQNHCWCTHVWSCHSQRLQSCNNWTISTSLHHQCSVIITSHHIIRHNKKVLKDQWIWSNLCSRGNYQHCNGYVDVNMPVSMQTYPTRKNIKKEHSKTKLNTTKNSFHSNQQNRKTKRDIHILVFVLHSGSNIWATIEILLSPTWLD